MGKNSQYANVTRKALGAVMLLALLLGMTTITATTALAADDLAVMYDKGSAVSNLPVYWRQNLCNIALPSWVTSMWDCSKSQLWVMIPADYRPSSTHYHITVQYLPDTSPTTTTTMTIPGFPQRDSLRSMTLWLCTIPETAKVLSVTVSGVILLGTDQAVSHYGS